MGHWMTLNRWWDESEDERYWLEVTFRDDIGTDLLAPVEGRDGEYHWTHHLITEVEDGDVVLHYEIDDRAITSWSRAAGGWWETDGWLHHGLDGPFRLPEPLTLDELRANEASVGRTLAEVKRTHRGSTYPPFQMRRDGLRPLNGYFAKWPRDLMPIFPQLAPVGTHSEPGGGRSGPVLPTDPEPPGIGTGYRRADEDPDATERDPFAVDPAVVERGVRGHARTQNALADMLEAEGLEPRSPDPTEPQFDLAWENGQALFVAEVKSLTSKNEERQLRLGIGQVLRYRWLLRGRAETVRAVLAVENKPRGSGWVELCAELGITFIWPSTMRSVIDST